MLFKAMYDLFSGNFDQNINFKKIRKIINNDKITITTTTTTFCHLLRKDRHHIFPTNTSLHYVVLKTFFDYEC